MPDSASLKVDRAAKHVRELIELFSKRRPFIFVVKTNTQNGERSAFTKKNNAVINDAALICGDVVHNLRSALDHVYWEIVSPHCTSDKERRSVQFPFTSKANVLHKALQDAYAQRAGTGFYCALRMLRPHGESAGNEMLSLVRDADNMDKHRLLIPTADYTKISGARLKAALPDCPFTINGHAIFSNSGFKWTNSAVPPDELGSLMPPTFHIFERELDMPVEIVLRIGQLGSSYPMVATLNQMVGAVRESIPLLRAGAASY